MVLCVLRITLVINYHLFKLMKVRKEKSIYHTLNMLSLDVTKKCLVAEGWSPVFGSKQVNILRAHVTLNQYVQLRTNLNLICADSRSIATSCIWFQFAGWGHFPGSAYEGVPTYIFSHKQVYYCFSGNCWCIWVSFTLNLSHVITCWMY